MADSRKKGRGTYAQRLARRRKVSGIHDTNRLPPPWPVLREEVRVRGSDA